jgi:hypothetical protein
VSREFLQSVSVGTDGFDIVVTNLPAVRGSVARRPSTVQKVGRRSDENKRRVLRVLRQRNRRAPPPLELPPRGDSAGSSYISGWPNVLGQAPTWHLRTPLTQVTSCTGNEHPLKQVTSAEGGYFVENRVGGLGPGEVGEPGSDVSFEGLDGAVNATLEL